MKLLLVNDKFFDQNLADKIWNTQISSMVVDIQKTGIDVLKSRYTDVGKVSLDELIEAVSQSIFRNIGYIKESKEGILKVGKCGRFDVYQDVSQAGFKTDNCDKDTPANSVGYEDPELSGAYQDQKIWCIAYDTGFKNIELLETGVYTSKQKAEDAAKEMSDTDMFRGTELTVIGIPIKNIDYGNTFFVPGEEDGLVEISDDLFFELAKQAHKENITVNELANTLLKEHIEKESHTIISDEEFLGEDSDIDCRDKE